MSEKRKGDTLKGIPKSIHKRELILDEEEFDASSFGGDEEDRTLDLTDANRTLSQLSYGPKQHIDYKPMFLKCQLLFSDFFAGLQM